VIALVQRIDALLPQTLFTRCGFDACRPYAEAIAAGEADIDRCPPGGEEGVAKLARALGRAAKPLSDDVGPAMPPQVARIEEADCIGCTKCIQACPVDAIVGAAQRMHTVIASWCTGCELCIPPCPVDCIVLEPTSAFPPADLSRTRHDERGARLARDAAERERRLEAYE